METKEIQETEQDLIKEAIEDNELIIVGAVLRLGDPPSYWTGYFPAYQSVRYKVEKVLKGNFSDAEISIDHVVVRNSKTAQPGDTPGLSSKFFVTGAKIIVFAMKANDGTWKNLYQTHGVHAFSEDTLQTIQSLL